MANAEWDEVSPYLDAVFEMSEADRTEWLSALRARDPRLAARLEPLLDAHRRLEAIVPLTRLLAAAPHTRLGAIARRNPPAVLPETVTAPAPVTVMVAGPASAERSRTPPMKEFEDTPP